MDRDRQLSVLARRRLTFLNCVVKDEPGQDIAGEKPALAATRMWIGYCQIWAEGEIDQSVAPKEVLRAMIGDGLLILA